MHTPSSSASPQRRQVPWAELASLFIGSRILIWLVAWLGGKIIAPGKFGQPDLTLLESFSRWDVTWFMGIARDGYHLTPGTASPIAFFPLFPLLSRLGGYLTGDPLVAGYLISNVAFFGALVLLWKLVEADSPADPNGEATGQGLRAARFLAFGPVSFFFSIPYSEATFLLLILGSVYAARLQRWWLAGFVGLLAALTRNAGILLVAPLLCEYLQVRLSPPFIRRDIKLSSILACLLPIGGLGLWASYLWIRFGNPLLFLEVQSAWGRKLTWPWVPFLPRSLWNFPAFHQVWFVGHTVVAFLCFIAAALNRTRLSYLILGAAMLLLNISARHLEAIPRLLSVIFPLYIGLTAIVNRWRFLEFPLLCLSSALLALSVILFTNGYWFT